MNTAIDKTDLNVNSDDATSLFSNTPLTELSSISRLHLSELLNCKKYLRAENGYERDWRGLAQLAQVRSFCNTINDDPMASLLREWTTRYPQTATFALLYEYLGIIDRWHVCDDLYEFLAEDARIYADKVRAEANTSTIISADSGVGLTESVAASEDSSNAAYEVSTPQPSISSTSDIPMPIQNASSDDLNTQILNRQNALNAHVMPLDANMVNSVSQNDDACEWNVLTRDDVLLAERGMPLQRYDAIVLYADADIQYAMEMQRKFEQNATYNFKLFFKNRDLLGGAFTHVALIELMDRCRYLLLILTRNFMAMAENRFLMNYVHSEQIEKNTRRIIPLAYDNCNPKTLHGLHTLKYNGSSEHFWSRLAMSIRAPICTPFLPTNQSNDSNGQVQMPYIPQIPTAPPLPVPEPIQLAPSFYGPPFWTNTIPQYAPVPVPFEIPLPNQHFAVVTPTSTTSESTAQTMQPPSETKTSKKLKKSRKPFKLIKSVFSRSN